MTEIKVTNFNTREDLDDHIEAIPDKEELMIVGTEEDLKKLNLRVGRKIHGVGCKIVKK